MRGLHNLVRRDINDRAARDPEAVRNQTRLDGVWNGCPVSAAMQSDLDKHVQGACPFRSQGRRDLGDNTVGEVSSEQRAPGPGTASQPRFHKVLSMINKK